MKTLSSRQKQIIEFISGFWLKRSYPPTVRDIVNGCGISSTSVVDYNLDILEREGYIRRHPGVSRGIELISRAHGGSQAFKVPLIGQIAAGTPIPVPDSETWNIAATSDTIDVTDDMTRGRDKVFALKVRGSSMIDALINDGDTVIMEHVNVVENGEMAAVWLKEEKEVTLKKVYRERGRIRLQPANSTMEPIYAAPDNIEVQGRVIAVIRQLD